MADAPTFITWDRVTAGHYVWRGFRIKRETVGFGSRPARTIWRTYRDGELMSSRSHLDTAKADVWRWVNEGTTPVT